MILRILASLFLGLSLASAATSSTPNPAPTALKTFNVGATAVFDGFIQYDFVASKGFKLYLSDGTMAIAKCHGWSSSVLNIDFVQKVDMSQTYHQEKEVYRSGSRLSKKYDNSQACQANLVYLASAPSSFSVDAEGNLTLGSAQ